MKTFTLTDLIEPENMIAWLNQDGPPPTVMVITRLIGPPRKQEARYANLTIKTDVPIHNEHTLGIWWKQYRELLAKDFVTSPHNRHKKQTAAQFLAECLSASGIRGGTVAARVQRAIQARPDLYRTPAQVEADAVALKAKQAEQIAQHHLAHGRDRNGKPLPTASVAVSERQREAAHKAWADSPREAVRINHHHQYAQENDMNHHHERNRPMKDESDSDTPRDDREERDDRRGRRRRRDHVDELAKAQLEQIEWRRNLAKTIWIILACFFALFCGVPFLLYAALVITVKFMN